MEYGNRAIQQSDNSIFQGISVARLEEKNEADPNIKNHLSINNATLDVPTDTHLKKKQTVRELIAYSKTTRAAILSKSEKKEDKNWVAAQKQNQLDPLLQDFSPALAGDGDPMITLNTLRRENILYRNQIFGLGGFHVALTAWRSMGRCYGPGVSRLFVSVMEEE